MPQLNNNFEIEFLKVLDKVHHECKIDNEAINYLNDIIRNIIDKIISSKDDNINYEKVMINIKLTLNGELLKHSISESYKSLNKYLKSSHLNDIKKTRREYAGLIFRIGNLEKMLPLNITNTALIFLASCLEYLTFEILELSGNDACDNNSRIITIDNINNSIINDEELNELINGVKAVNINDDYTSRHVKSFNEIKNKEELFLMADFYFGEYWETIENEENNRYEQYLINYIEKEKCIKKRSEEEEEIGGFEEQYNSVCI